MTVFATLSRKGALGVIGLVLATVLAVGWRVRSGGRDARRHHVVLGVSTLRISAAVFVAIERRLFAERGLDVEVRPYPTAQPMIDDLAAGRLDAAGYAAWPIVFLGSRRARRPFRVATSLIEDAEHRVSTVLARRGSGLRFPASAPGRRIGVLPTVAYRRWLPAILSAAGLDPGATTVVPVDPTVQAAALRDGAVDLLFTNDPMATAIVASGVGEIADDGPPCARRLGSPFPFGTFAMSAALADERPETARAMVAAVDEAIARGTRDGAVMRRAMLPYLRPEERAFVDAYPVARYEPWSPRQHGLLRDELAREREMGIVAGDVRVGAWAAGGP